ncbi:glycosyltransferase family 39 protein, partial [bacterium]|nr:glycosyltransferase family 39 protein [bacterium]
MLMVIVGVGFGCRLWRINYPLMDWHSFRQADTASVTWEFVKHNYPIWLPHYHDLGKIQSGQVNLDGYRMVEFPIINYLLALILHINKSWSVEMVSRLASVLASTGSIVCLYYFCRQVMREVTEKKATIVSLLAAATIAILPYSVYYGRAVLPEPFQVFFGLLSLLAFSYYLQKRNWQLWLATAVSLMLALLLKPTTVFWGPVWLYLAWHNEGWQCLKRKDLWFLAIAAVAPLGWWRLFICQFPSGIPANAWLLNGPIHGTPPRWRPMWWRWLFYERLIKLWLGYGGAVFA